MLQPADLFALRCALKVLKVDYGLKELTDTLESWMEQIEQTKLIMNKIIDMNVQDDDHDGLPNECR